jgi:integrase
MALVKRGRLWWYRVQYQGTLHQGSTKMTNKQAAREIEENFRRALRDGVPASASRKERARPLKELIDEYVGNYKLTHETTDFLVAGASHLKEHLGNMLVGSIDVATVLTYRAKRKEDWQRQGNRKTRKKGASNSSINQEVTILLRIMEERGDELRNDLKRKKKLRMPPAPEVGKAFTVTEQDKLLKVAAENEHSPHISFALQLALNGGMRDLEIRSLTWAQINFAKNVLVVGKSKTKASSHRIVPLNGDLLPAFIRHREWYVKEFNELKPEWFVFPFGQRGSLDPTRHVTTLKTAWTSVRKKAGVKGRWHDTRHTVVSQLQEQGESGQTTKSIVGHVSQAMLEKYSHIGMEAKREALEEMRAHRDRKREKELAAAKQFEEATDTKAHTVN